MKKSYKIFLICCFVIILISIISIKPIKSYSNFYSSFSCNGSIHAAEEKDIISSFVVEGTSPPVIKIKKGAGLGYNPVVYFKVQGLISEYILNTNPIKLENEDVYSIDLNINISYSQVVYLLNHPEVQEIKGTIIMNYLNGYIAKNADVCISREYLLEKYCKALNISYDKYNEKAILDEIILNAASEKNWNLSFTTSNELILDVTQDKIIDIIFPGVKAYNSSLLNMISSQQNTIHMLEEKVDSLNSTLNNITKSPNVRTTTESAISCN